MEQKFVQRCETKVDADACKASYSLIVYTENWTFYTMYCTQYKPKLNIYIGL